MTDTLHRNVDVEDVESSAPPAPSGPRPGRGRWVGAGAAIALGAAATVALLALRDDDRNHAPTPTPTATTSASEALDLPAEQRQAIPPAMQEVSRNRQLVREAAERAQIAAWARANDLTGLSPASVAAQ
jgi:hypothetical protein